MNYSIHKILKIKANTSVPIPSYFRVESIQDPDFTILCKSRLDFKKPKDDKILKGNYYFWGHDQKLFIDYCFMNAKLSIQNLYDRTRLECTSSFKQLCKQESWEDLIFAILSIKLIQKGYTFVHAGCLSRYGEGVMIFGMQDTGKTSTILSMLDGEEFKFLSDDLVIAGKDNVVRAYPLEVRLSPRTLGGKVVLPTVRRKFLRLRILSTFMEKFARKDITKLIRIPYQYIADKCKVEKIFVLGGYGREKVIELDKDVAFNVISNLSLQMPNLLETYLDMYYHLFNVRVFKLLEEKDKIIKKVVKAANCFKVTAPQLEGYSRAIKKVL